LLKEKKVNRVKTSGKSKDEFEHMVNWKRVFEQTWQQIRWLISYGQINEIAFRKILKKYTKNFYAIKENTIRTRITQIIEGKRFKIVEGSETK
jgi:copper homeostasis protein CutC